MLLSLLLLAVDPSFAAHAPAYSTTTTSAAVEADAQDLRELKAVVASWKAAMVTGNVHAQRQADAALERWLRAEIAEAGREVDKARMDAARTNAEARRGSRSARADLADDRGDLAREEAYLARLTGVARALDALDPAFRDGRVSRGQYAQKVALLGELENLATTDLVASQTELREDRRDAPDHRMARAY